MCWYLQIRQLIVVCKKYYLEVVLRELSMTNTYECVDRVYIYSY